MGPAQTIKTFFAKSISGYNHASRSKSWLIATIVAAIGNAATAESVHLPDILDQCFGESSSANRAISFFETNGWERSDTPLPALIDANLMSLSYGSVSRFESTAPEMALAEYDAYVSHASRDAVAAQGMSDYNIFVADDGTIVAVAAVTNSQLQTIVCKAVFPSTVTGQRISELLGIQGEQRKNSMMDAYFLFDLQPGILSRGLRLLEPNDDAYAIAVPNRPAYATYLTTDFSRILAS